MWGMDALKCRFEIGDKGSKVLLGAGLACDQNIIGVRVCGLWQQFDQCRTQPTSDAVSNDCVADFLGDREAKSGANVKVAGAGI